MGTETRTLAHQGRACRRRRRWGHAGRTRGCEGRSFYEREIEKRHEGVFGRCLGCSCTWINQLHQAYDLVFESRMDVRALCHVPSIIPHLIIDLERKEHWSPIVHTRCLKV